MMERVLPSFRLPGLLSFITVRPLDIIDILLVAYLIYRVFHLMKGTRAIQILFGVLILSLVAIAAQIYQLPGTSWIIGSFRSVWVVAVVVLFQPEIRNALTQLGRNRFFGLFWRGEVWAIEQVTEACRMLTARGLGALIVFEKNDGLRDYTASGTEIGARISHQLLVALFVAPGPLHDGATVIRGDTVVAAGCTLPISQDQLLAMNYGMRHRAAVGLTEETDAVVVVVSEEKQTIKLARYGRLIDVDNLGDLRRKLTKALHAKVQPSDETVPPVDRGGAAADDSKG